MRLVVLASLAAVLSAVAAGAAPAIDARVDGRRAQLDDYYLFHAKFTLKYDIDWLLKTGSEDEPCSSWRVDSGRTTVIVEDAPWTQKRKGRKKVVRKDGIPGSIRISARSLRDDTKGQWATGSAIGWAKAIVNRSWVQRGGVNWTDGCGTKPEPFERYQEDCGRREFRTRTATFIPQTRRRFDTLEDIRGAQGGRAALMVTIPGPAKLYKLCITNGAPDLPLNVGFPVPTADKVNLAHLSEGETQDFAGIPMSGDCSDNITPEDSCTFTLSLAMDVTRWKPGTPFP